MGRGPLEIFKFTLYLGIPFSIMYVTSNPESLQRLSLTTKAIVCPPEGPRPPTGSIGEVRAHIAASKKAKDESMAAGAVPGAASGAPPAARATSVWSSMLAGWLHWGGI